MYNIYNLILPTYTHYSVWLNLIQNSVSIKYIPIYYSKRTFQDFFVGVHNDAISSISSS